MKLESIDELLALGHGDVRAFDSVVVIRLKKTISNEEILLGAKQAQDLFPKTAKHPILYVPKKSLFEFINSDLSSSFHLELARVENDCLALKMSHLLGDAVSMLLWLEVLLGQEISGAALKYKSFPKKKDTPYRKILNSELWPSPQKTLGRERGIIQAELQHRSFSSLESLNDVMSLALLRVIKLKRKSLWVPVNVREHFWEGFGNGLSRLRLYPPPEGDLISQLAHLRKQKKEALINGEVSLPPTDLDLNKSLERNLFKLWLHRPWADWSSLSFSHLVDRSRNFSDFEEIWGVSNIMPKQNGAIFAFSYPERSFLTLSYDPLNVTNTQAQTLMKDWQKEILEVMRELSP